MVSKAGYAMAPYMAGDDATTNISGAPADFKAKRALLEAFMRKGTVESSRGDADSCHDSGVIGVENRISECPQSDQASDATVDTTPLLAAAATITTTTPKLQLVVDDRATVSDTGAPEVEQTPKPCRYSNSQSALSSLGLATDSQTVAPMQTPQPHQTPRQDSIVGSSTNSPRSSIGDVSALLSCGSRATSQGLGVALSGEKRPAAWQRRNLEEEIKRLHAELAQAKQHEMEQAEVNQRLRQENAKMAKELDIFRNREGLLRTLHGGSPTHGLNPIASFQSSLTDSIQSERGSGRRHGRICRGVCKIFGRR